MEKTLIRQNAQWNGKMFDHLCPRDIMDNLLKKKTMRHVQILTVYVVVANLLSSNY